MAFNQASFVLFAPRYGPLVNDASAKTESGGPLKIISTELIDSTAPKITTVAVQQWFINRRFSEKEGYSGSQILFRDEHAGPLGKEAVIDLSLPLDQDEVRALRIRFLLTPHTPDLLPGWKSLISELGHDFGLKLMDGSHRLLPCIDFCIVLAENQNFREFQKNYGWII